MYNANHCDPPYREKASAAPKIDQFFSIQLTILKVMEPSHRHEDDGFLTENAL